ncbi:asparagine--tRNA ligase, partial [Candidatus Bathyarchaeota archaeon]
MQHVVTVKEILRGTLDAKQVRVRGWLQNKRTGGGIIFLLLRDGSGVVQCTLRKGKVDEKTFEDFQSARIESSVELRGEVKADPRAPGGREIQVDEGRVVHPALEEFPIAKQFHGPEFLLDQRHLFVRSDKMRSILRLRAVVLSAVRDWFEKHDFTEVHVPSLTSAA